MNNADTAREYGITEEKARAIGDFFAETSAVVGATFDIEKGLGIQVSVKGQTETTKGVDMWLGKMDERNEHVIGTTYYLGWLLVPFTDRDIESLLNKAGGSISDWSAKSFD